MSCWNPQMSDQGRAGRKVTSAQRDFAHVISNTRSVKLISPCTQARWVRRCREGWSVQEPPHERKKELIASDGAGVRCTERGIT